MIKLNRTTEYGLMALRYMSAKARSHQAASVTSARELAERYDLPFEITAKTLQRLKDYGLIQSAQGARGGYTLQCEVSKMNLGQFLEMMEGPQGVVGCATQISAGVVAPAPCEYGSKCELKSMMRGLNGRVREFLSTITLTDVLGEGLPAELIPTSSSMIAMNSATAASPAAAIAERNI